MQTEAPKTFVCATCASDDVQLDAWAAWSTETQSWELAATLQQAYCRNCDGETSLLERPLSSSLQAGTPTGPVDYEIIVNGETVYHRSPDPVAALEEHAMAHEHHRGEDPRTRISIRRHTGDAVEPIDYAELHDAAHQSTR